MVPTIWTRANSNIFVPIWVRVSQRSTGEEAGRPNCGLLWSFFWIPFGVCWTVRLFWSFGVCSYILLCCWTLPGNMECYIVIQLYSYIYKLYVYILIRIHIYIYICNVLWKWRDVWFHQSLIWHSGPAQKIAQTRWVVVEDPLWMETFFWIDQQ